MLLHACLPYLLPHFSGLGRPRPASREEVVAGLPLATLTPPSLITIALADPVFEAQSNRCMSRQELVVAAGH